MEIFTFEVKTDNIIEWLKPLWDFIKKLATWRYTIFLVKWRKRSNKQNRMYRAILQWLSDYSWNDTEELHELCKNKFLSHTHHSDMFGEMIVVKSTRKLTTKQFAEYVDKVANFAAERWVVVQDNYLEYNQQ